MKRGWHVLNPIGFEWRDQDEQTRSEAVRIENERESGCTQFVATSMVVRDQFLRVIREVQSNEFGDYGLEREIGKR